MKRFDQVIFLHISKTGGTTLSIPLRLIYGYGGSVRVSDPRHATLPDHYAQLPEQEKSKIRAIHGHVFYGMHERCPGTSVYVTLLREPVKRMASTYRMMRAEWPEAGPASSLSFREYVIQRYHHKDKRDRLNMQVRRIAGVTGGDTPVDASTLERAKRNIEKDFLVCGTTERYDETLMLMKRRLGWRIPPFYIRQRARKKDKDSIPSDTAALIRERNRWDVELYRYVAERLEDEIAREENGFRKEVERFRRINRVFSVLGRIPLKFFREAREYLKARDYGWVKRRFR